MADVANRYPENAPGKYYVDNQCIDCDLCRETAPANFKRNDDGGYSLVYKQPESAEEEKVCKEAKEGCPVEPLATTAKRPPNRFDFSTSLSPFWRQAFFVQNCVSFAGALLQMDMFADFPREVPPANDGQDVPAIYHPQSSIFAGYFWSAPSAS